MPEICPTDTLRGDSLAERVLPPGLDRMVFIVGCARSGTTWLQLLLHQHPIVCTTQETNLFLYLADMRKRWVKESNQNRLVGLRALLHEDRFKGLLADFARSAISESFITTPETRILVEKTPMHVRHADLIHWLIPDAYFLHIIRDPRDVVGSLRRAGREWNPPWSRLGVEDHSKRWVRDVAVGRAIGEWASERYYEVRYEDLRASGGRALMGIFDWLRAPVSLADCESWVEACELAKLRSASEETRIPWRLTDEPPTFWGERPRGAGGLSPSDLRTVEDIAGPLMRDLGYTAFHRSTLKSTVRAHVRRMRRIAGRLRRSWLRKSLGAPSMSE